MKKILYTNFNQVSDVLKNVIDGINVDAIRQKQTVADVWKSIAGKKFELKTRALSVNAKGVLFVACESPAITNELFLLKKSMLKRLEAFDSQIEREIKDIAFSHKLWK